MIVALFCILGFGAQLNITTFLTGNWNITSVNVLPDGVEDEESRSRFEVVFQRSETNPYDYLGELMEEDKGEEVVLTPVSKIKLSVSDEDPNELTVSIGGTDSDDYDEFTKISVNTDLVENTFTFSGKIAKDTFSFVSLSDFEAEITCYNQETKTMTLYRLEKERPPNQNSPSLMSFMPMIMMMVMQCMNQPRMPQAQGAQGGQGGAAGGNGQQQ